MGCLIVLLVFYTVAGNSATGNFVYRWLEQEYTEINPLDEGTFDAVVVLGGGTGTGPSGQVQLNGAGDRVVLGARLFHAGRTRYLACTGRKIAQLNPQGNDPSFECFTIWSQLSIPEERIITLTGRNTREELAAVAQAAKQHEWKKIGIVTSAWHMRRVMREADRCNLQVHPLPTNFRSGPFRLTPLSPIPGAAGFASNQTAFKELLAIIVK